MMQTMDRLIKELYPLYRELHTWERYELAKKYNTADWSAGIEVKGLNLDSVLAAKNAEWIVKEGEKLYTSIGFPALPATFWQKSSLYPYKADSAVKKNNHASAWHMDLNNDVRSLMSVEPNAEWFETANHELGHIYYYLTYTNPDVPPLLRKGANRAYHEAIGSMMARGEEYCDAATKTHINDDPAQYYDYALSYVILYQLHNHIAKNILHQDPHATNYFGQTGI
eukprot:gene24980-25093_t